MGINEIGYKRVVERRATNGRESLSFVKYGGNQ